MDERSQVVGMWLIIPGMIGGFLGWLILARFLPPHSPSWDADTIAGIYAARDTLIRAGVVLMQATIGFFAPFVAIVYVQMRRIEGKRPAMLSITALITNLINVLVIGIISGMFWIAASFRPERNPEITQMLNDLGWLYVAFPISCVVAANVAMGVCFLQDRHPQPLFARWVGYFNIWVAVLVIPAVLIPFFKTGPFAWNGIIAFWLPLVVFSLWIVVMLVSLIKAIKRKDYEPVY